MPLTYSETIEFLYSRLPMFTRIGPRAFKKDLTNTLALMEALGNPHQKFKSIHVAGTNGKGSTSHMLAALLQQSGYKTGLYTSPHIVDFGERIRINGKMVKQQFVIDFVERTKGLMDKIEPSYFELAVAMAYTFFAIEKVDVAVVETGLGGKLDSTNIISPVLSVITNIGLDHIGILGKTLEKIAGQKAGIIKPKTPVVIGEYLKETRPVFEAVATEKNAPMFFAEDMYAIQKMSETSSIQTFKVTDKFSSHSEIFETDLLGNYQEKNVRTVIAAEKVLIDLGFEIPVEAEKAAFKNVKKLTGLRGRWDIVNSSPVEIHDVGHNEDGIKMILEKLEENYSGKKWHFVLGFVKDKDVDHVLSLFPNTADYYFTQAHIPRAMPCAQLRELAVNKGLAGDCFADVNAAIETARASAGRNDVIILCGSFFTLAELKQ